MSLHLYSCERAPDEPFQPLTEDIAACQSAEQCPFPTLCRQQSDCDIAREFRECGGKNER